MLKEYFYLKVYFDHSPLIVNSKGIGPLSRRFRNFILLLTTETTDRTIAALFVRYFIFILIYLFLLSNLIFLLIQF